MRNTKRTVFLAASAAALAAVLSACYSSEGPGRDASDVSPDRPPDAVHDTAPDTVPDPILEPIVDVAQNEILPPPDIVANLPRGHHKLSRTEQQKVLPPGIGAWCVGV